jgi:GT2 family glycosyltransferase
MFAFRKYFDRESSLVSFYGYVKRADPHFWTVLMNRFRVRGDKSDINYHIVRTYVGPYGGMLISRETVKILGIPDSSYYLFGDDFEYSSRAARVGIKMFTVVSAVVEDIDRSEALPSGYLSNLSDPARLYYSTRNHLYLRKSLATSSGLYLIDLFAFLAFMTIRLALVLFSNPNLVIPLASSLWRATLDSQCGAMGRSDAWEL